MATKQKLENKTYIPASWEHVSCPICGSSESTLYEKFGNEWQYTYVLCKSCNLVYQSPRPVYDEAFVYDAYEFYFEEYKQYATDQIQFYQTNGKSYERDLIDILKYDKNHKAILDVGCSVGCLLYYAKPHFAIVNGVEVSNEQADIAKKTLDVEVFTDKFENLSTNTRYSCISISHVLEHIPNPHEWLQKSKQLLDKDGILVISVPNMFSFSRKLKLLYKRMGIRRGKWEAWRTPDHLFEPTIKSMQTLFKMNGFEVVDFYTYSRSSQWFDNLIHRKLFWGSNLRFIAKSSDI